MAVQSNMANITITQIRMKRGNTAASSTYVGPLGELLVDTGLRTIRVQDGATPGGMATLATNVQLQALGTYANTTFGTSSYGNANVALYLPTSSIIGNINANVTAANVNISSLTSNAATQATLINAINANVTAANAAITSLTSNAAIQASLLDTLTGNAASQSTLLDTLTSNAATQSVSLTTLLSNAATQQTSLTDLVANAAAQAQAIADAAGTYGNANVEAYIGANIGTLYSNAAAQASSINAVTANIGSFYTYANLNYGTSSYADANVAAYLPTYTGNIAGNIVKNGYTWTFSNTGTTTFPTGVTLSNARGANTVNFLTGVDKSFQIETQTNATSKLWNFTTDGNLTLPQNANINFSNGVSILSTVTDLYANAAVQSANIATLFSNAATQAGTITTLQTQVYANANVATYLPTYSGAISANIAKNGYVWTFGIDGTTLFPDAAIDGGTAPIELKSRSWSQLTYNNSDMSQQPNKNHSTTFYVEGGDALLEIFRWDSGNVMQHRSWTFSNDGSLSLPDTGTITFPDATVQTTAFSNAAVATYLSNYDGGINFTASPAVITGLGNISSANFTFANGVNILSTVTGSYGNTQANALLSSNTVSTISTTGNITTIANVIATTFRFANGVNILSTVGAGSYGNANVASYMLHFDGDIEFTSSTARIGNVDVITVGDHIRSPSYQFSNGTSILAGITGTYSNTNVASYLTTATITTTGNITAGKFIGDGSGLTGVALKTTGSWTVTTGTNTYSFTVPASGTYQLWVDCNIPNGILVWNATATVTNSNVPVVGAQYAWVYNGNGSPIDFTSIPNQFIGTGNTIVRSSVAPSATTNRFDFGLNNTSGGNVTVRYGWIQFG